MLFLSSCKRAKKEKKMFFMEMLKKREKKHLFTQDAKVNRREPN